MLRFATVGTSAIMRVMQQAMTDILKEVLKK